MEIVSGLGEKPHVTSQQFRQILIDGRQTQIQVVGDLLLGAG